MPHLVLETSPGLAEDPRRREILERLVARLGAMPTVDASAVKARWRSCGTENFAVGEGHAPGFVHLTISILEGRPEELRGRIADALWSELHDCFAESLASGAAETTIELREMARSTYRKDAGTTRHHA